MTDQPATTVAKKRWTAEEDATLTRLANLGAANIATALSRPVSQVRGRAKRLGISLRTSGQTRGRKGRFTTAQDSD